MQAIIINIGNELLSGKTINSNGASIAKEIAKIGITTKTILSIADNREDLIQNLTSSLKTVDIVFITGGLGPTNDDMTKQILAEYYTVGMKTDIESKENIKAFLQKRNLPITKINLDQAKVPENAIVFPNLIGTASGMGFYEKGKYVFSLPGVPFEMQSLMGTEIIPFLKGHLNLDKIHVRDILTQGMGESFLSQHIEKWEKALPKGISLAYLPSPGLIKLRLTGKGNEKNKIEEILQNEIDTLKKIIPKLIWGYDDDKLEKLIGITLKEQGYCIATAESCTGGYLAHLITSISGSSVYFKGSIIAYSNEIKEKQLHVSSQTIEKHGAVSKEVVKEMAEGVCNEFNTEVAISTSGVAGPSGGTKEKPVGTVWIAVATPKKTMAQKFIFGDNRQRNIIRSSYAALNMLRKCLLDK
jgi:competence/damage-inducible protein CinA-like protein